MLKLKIRNELILLSFLVLFSALFVLETSPFAYIVPGHPFSESIKNRLEGDTLVYLYTGNLITEGRVPYLDSFDHKGPFLYLLFALGISIGNTAGVWFIQILFLAVSAYFAYTAARYFTEPFWASLSAGLAVLWYAAGGTRPETFAVPFLFFTLYSFVKYFQDDFQIGRMRTFFLGISFGSVALMKLNLAFPPLFFSAVFFFISLKRKEFVSLILHILLFLSGTAVIALPIAAWLIRCGAFSDFIADYWDYNLYSYGQTPTISKFVYYFLPFLIKQSPRMILNWVNHLWYNFPALLLFGFCTITKRKSERFFYFSLTVLLLSGVVLIGMKGYYFPHYTIPLVPLYLVFFAISFNFLKHLFRNRSFLMFFFVFLFFLPVLHSAVIPPIAEKLQRRYISNRYPDLDLTSYGTPLRFDRPTLDLADYLKEHTGKETRISGSGFGVYWYSKRFCASKFSFRKSQQSFDDTFPKDSAGLPPEYVFEMRREEYSFSDFLFGKLNQPLLETSPEIEEYLEKNYTKVYCSDCYDLYKRNE